MAQTDDYGDVHAECVFCGDQISIRNAFDLEMVELGALACVATGHLEDAGCVDAGVAVCAECAEIVAGPDWIARGKGMQMRSSAWHRVLYPMLTGQADLCWVH